MRRPLTSSCPPPHPPRTPALPSASATSRAPTPSFESPAQSSASAMYGACAHPCQLSLIFTGGLLSLRLRQGQAVEGGPDTRFSFALTLAVRGASARGEETHREVHGTERPSAVEQGGGDARGAICAERGRGMQPRSPVISRPFFRTDRSARRRMSCKRSPRAPASSTSRYRTRSAPQECTLLSSRMCPARPR